MPISKEHRDKKERGKVPRYNASEYLRAEVAMPKLAEGLADVTQ